MFCLIRKLLSVASLLVALVSAAIWIRGYWNMDELRWRHQASLPQNHFQIRTISLTSATGGMLLGIAEVDIDKTRMSTLHHIMEPDYPFRSGDDFKFRTSRFPLPWYATQNYGDMLSRGVAGFSFERNDGVFLASPHLRRLTWLSIPIWLITLLCSLPGLLHFRSNLKRRLRLRRGLCPTCGYDLRESLGTCPECGAAPSLS